MRDETYHGDPTEALHAGENGPGISSYTKIARHSALDVWLVAWYARCMGAWKWVLRAVPWVLLALTSVWLLVLLLRDVEILPFLDSARDNVIFITALAGIASVSFAGWSFARTRRSVQEAASLDAWNLWSDSTRKERILISRTLGMQTVREDQAEALTTPGQAVLNKDRVQLQYKEKENLLDAVVVVLNGLERIAVGIKFGIYRRDVVAQIGGTIIVRTWERFQPYVERQRNLADLTRRQENAWIQLEELALHIRKKKATDAARLEALRRQ